MAQEELNRKASKKIIAESLQELRNSFACRSDEFFASMANAIIGGEYTDKQLMGAVKEVINTIGYNQLSIASVIQACNNQPPRMCEWAITPMNEIRRSTYDQFKADQYRFGEESVKFIRDIE